MAIPLDLFLTSLYSPTSSFYQRHYYHPLIYLHLYTKDVMGGQTQLGWCQIPTTDILDGLSPARCVRRLSYRLRARDGSRGHGVVNIAVKLDCSGLVICPQSQRPTSSDHMPRWV
ncbi:hypothetical protein Vadar_034010 [Vaccinium darrowii]|uniref:Uncharacterized protein n=1 Tax=Vaccinium darrowii TaxID=229202 RepID=A0ACB7Z8A8_9ERIC|nr:hypothetical protein Vadar_034010 [Vaccinium darrowii]